MIAERLDPDGPRLTCTWLKSRLYGPPVESDSRACSNDAAWIVYDDDHGWFLCDGHRRAWNVPEAIAS